MGEIFDKLRRKLAGWVLGERTAIYLPAEYRALKEGQLYERLPDHELAQLARYFFYVSRNVNRELADGRGIPAAVFTHSQAVLSVIRYAIDANATEATFTQSGEIAGNDIGVWQVKVTKQPDDYEFGAPGVQKEYDPEDPSRLVKLSMSYSMPLPSKDTPA